MWGFCVKDKKKIHCRMRIKQKLPGCECVEFLFDFAFSFARSHSFIEINNNNNNIMRGDLAA